MKIDERLGAAHAALGQVQLYYDWDFTGARRAYERAVQLGPSQPLVLSAYAWYLLLVEENAEEALEYSERLLRVAPLDVRSRERRFKYLFYSRQYERALEEVERIRELDPSYVDVDLPVLYYALGRFEEAHRANIAFHEQCGALCDPIREALERGWADGGWEGSWRAWLDLMTSIEWYSPFTIAFPYTMIGETDQAFAWLERGYRERDSMMIYLKAHPGWDPLRSDPRFDDLLRRIGFPEE